MAKNFARRQCVADVCDQKQMGGTTTPPVKAATLCNGCKSRKASRLPIAVAEIASMRDMPLPNGGQAPSSYRTKTRQRDRQQAQDHRDLRLYRRAGELIYQVVRL